MAQQTKNRKALNAKLGDNMKLYAIDEAIQALKDLSTVKFDQTVEIALNLGVDPRHADQMVRGMVTLPSGTGKDVKVAVFARGDKAEAALAAGADRVGAEDLLEEMQAGNLDYGRVIATPDMMGIVGRLGKVLGPKGLMPNPKLGTVTPNVADAVKAAKSGQIEFRVEKAGIIHGGIGCRSRTRRSAPTSTLSSMRSSRPSRPALRASTCARSACPRRWARASRSTSRRCTPADPACGITA